MVAYRTTIQNGNFAARVETDDFLDLVRDQNHLHEMQALLDRHMVLHLSPQKEITAEGVGKFSLFLGMPANTAPRRAGATPISADYPFIGNFSSSARPLTTEPRVPNYIESLHYDGISAYSVQASFNAEPMTPMLWSDMRAAYAGLTPELKKIVDTRNALHAFVPPPGASLRDFPPLDEAKAARRPLRIRHPRTGEPVLYLPKNPASEIEGMSRKEGIAVLNELWSRVSTSPVRYTASATHNQMFVWDGLGTTHTNPAYPRDRNRTLWFFIIPGKSPDVEPYKV
jgi:alpha-ketoglutarate-dependent taurine dioxygenase